MDDTPYGRNPSSDGWFVLNLGDALAARNEAKGGAVYPLEPREVRFTDFGVNVHVVWPGEPSALYHSESVREAFLVLSGECTLIVEEEERPLRQWTSTARPERIFVGAGDGPRDPHDRRSPAGRRTLHYPVSEVAPSMVRPLRRTRTRRATRTGQGPTWCACPGRSSSASARCLRQPASQIAVT